MASLEEAEKMLRQKEIELLQEEEVWVPEGNEDGYGYKSSCIIKDLQSWEVGGKPPFAPMCSSADWCHSDVKFEVGEGIAYLSLNNPDNNNALTQSMLQALNDASMELHRRREEIRIVVLRAEGKMFCAGTDPKSLMAKADDSEIENKKGDFAIMKFFYYFQVLPQFTVALAQGSAMGSGVALLACCDMVASLKTARFTISEPKLGGAPATSAPFVTRKLGPAFSKRVLCTGENFSAEAMKSMGLITTIVEEEGEFTKWVQEVCDKITLCAPRAATKAKNLVQNVSFRPLSQKLLEFTGGELADVRIGEEAIVGMQAVQAKTKAYWAENPLKPLY